MSSEIPQTSEKKENVYIFNCDWSIVVRGFYDKYPNPKMDMVISNKLIGLIVGDDNVVKIKRIQHTKLFFFMWAYILEEISIDSNKKILEMKSQILKKSGVFPVVGTEYITYKAIKDGLQDTEKTFYIKRLELEGSVNKFMSYFGDGFKKGIQIVEENSQLIKNMSADEWVYRFSKKLSI